MNTEGEMCWSLFFFGKEISFLHVDHRQLKQLITVLLLTRQAFVYIVVAIGFEIVLICMLLFVCLFIFLTAKQPFFVVNFGNNRNRLSNGIGIERVYLNRVSRFFLASIEKCSCFLLNALCNAFSWCFSSVHLPVFWRWKLHCWCICCHV